MRTCTSSSSLHEGLGTSVLDAMALGIPVASTRAGGLPELLHDGAGMLAPPGDPDALADAVARLLTMPELAPARSSSRAPRRSSISRAARMAERGPIGVSFVRPIPLTDHDLRLHSELQRGPDGGAAPLEDSAGICRRSRASTSSSSWTTAPTTPPPEVLEPYARVLPLTVIRHPERRGYAASVEALLRQAVDLTDRPKRDAAILMHADFAHNPRPFPTSSGASRAAPISSWPRAGSRARPLAPARWSAATRRRCCGAWSRCPACGTWSPASRPSGWWRSETRSGASRSGCSSTDGWAANAELYWRAGRYSRRVETVTSVERHDLRSRPSRAEAWSTLAGAVGRAPDRCGPRRSRRARSSPRPGGKSRPRRSRLERAPADDRAAAGAAPSAPQAARLTAAAPVPAYPVGRRRDADLLRQARDAVARLGTLEVARIDTVRGTESFRFRFRLQGKTIIYSLDDVLESCVGTHDLISRRFVQDFVENDKPTNRRYEIFPDSGFYREEGQPEHAAHAGRAARRCGVLLFRAGDAARGRQEVHLSTGTSGKRRTRSRSR